MAKRVEGLWIIQGVHLTSSGKEYDYKPRVATTRRGRDMALQAEKRAIRIKMIHYELKQPTITII